jgi:pimeloyl-ACP methyl ester carboxylesterase
MDDARTLDLSDGRSLGYSLSGDPNGRPCLLVHGFSSSRRMAGWALPDTRLRRGRVRLVAVDRPGYGLSSPHQGAGFGDWTDDAAALANHLGLDRFAVLGVSMGAGSALVLAARRPDLVAATAILGGMPPVDGAGRWAPRNRADALYWSLARHAPRLLRRLTSTSARGMAAAARGDERRLAARVARGLSEPDRRVFEALLAEPGGPAAFAADVRESSRQGGAAMADDLVRHLGPWGFDPADVPGPVRLWHGVDDPKVPVELARRLAEGLDSCTARYVPGGHFAAFAHMDEVFGEILDGIR